jgi:hypothetical protein
VENLTWALNQPEFLEAGENCLHMRIYKNASRTALSDRNCSDKYIYACEVWQFKKANKNVMQTFVLFLGKKPDVPSC